MMNQNDEKQKKKIIVNLEVRISLLTSDSIINNKKSIYILFGK